MTINVMQQYIEKIVKNKISRYMKLIFEHKYEKRICERYMDAYIKIRYNNFAKNEMEEDITLRQKILKTLQHTQELLIEEFPEDEKLIKDMHMFFYYILYFDGVVYYKNLEDKIDKIYKTRVKVLNKDSETFKEDLQNLIKEFSIDEDEYINKFASEEFELKVTEYNIKNVYRVNLKSHIKFPAIYSEMAIKKAFNTGLVREDKLYIEYYLTVLRIINDLKKLNFKRQYIVEFADTLLKKDKKIKSVLNIIDNPAIQDKINLKIKYDKYVENEEEINVLIKNGYHMAVILDESFEVNYYNVEKLGIFNYVIINKNLEKYENIMNYRKMIKNLIEV